MSIISKIIKGVLGDKPTKDRKQIWPVVEQINKFQKSLELKSDNQLRENYINIKNELADLISIQKEELIYKKEIVI